jgi:hypothetical protein
MKTPLDETLFRLMDAHSDWASGLTPEEADLLLRRRRGASLKELAERLHLTAAGVRHRLYGAGCGPRRRGGVLGKLHGLAARKRRSLLEAKSADRKSS